MRRSVRLRLMSLALYPTTTKNAIPNQEVIIHA
jgi:hypothetical protein